LENIQEIKKINDLNLYGLDVNSGAEIAPGIKDVRILSTMLDTIKSFSHEIRR
jgi:phosphoribosylanthranilate isomerase